LKWIAWVLWWGAGVGVFLWLGPVMVSLYLIVSGAIGVAFGRR